ncbi:hypothetical protein CA85_23390 [Allorhodopirellula solitaria]|uniref:Uncharacterized protein n=1 Tax=Allorhodopirellula solitaria TaxID=2527987 RepID=A0A5C5XXT4_9BACT|nr:hypothetical protein CA85_23390 [Allorhodopirellula solitaria]
MSYFWLKLSDNKTLHAEPPIAFSEAKVTRGGRVNAAVPQVTETSRSVVRGDRCARSRLVIGALG